MEAPTIDRLANDDDARGCAAIMCSSDPWLTLGRSFDECLSRLTDTTREIWVARLGALPLPQRSTDGARSSRPLAGRRPAARDARRVAASERDARVPAYPLGGEIAGFVILNMQGGFVGYIQTICVAASSRGAGLGTRIMQFAEERIFREFPNVFLCVSSFNTRAREFYERLGYKVVGELTEFLVRGHDELLMRKTLGPMSEFKASPQPTMSTSKGDRA
jgi:ribosomal protein S18 acetylase RimI-like enzyme